MDKQTLKILMDERALKLIKMLIESLDVNAFLSKEDCRMLEFIKTQLRDNWKTPLLNELRLIYRKHYILRSLEEVYEEKKKD